MSGVARGLLWSGGRVEHPQWYRNLTADPQVRLQLGAERFIALARTADAAEKATLWPIMAKIFPMYDSYQKKTSRDIPLVILERLPPP